MSLQGELRTKKNGKTILSEETIWSYIVQLASAIKTAHAAGLALRSIDPSKILVTSKHRYALDEYMCLFIDHLFVGYESIVWQHWM